MWKWKSQNPEAKTYTRHCNIYYASLKLFSD